MPNLLLRSVTATMLFLLAAACSEPIVAPPDAATSDLVTALPGRFVVVRKSEGFIDSLQYFAKGVRQTDGRCTWSGERTLARGVMGLGYSYYFNSTFPGCNNLTVFAKHRLNRVYGHKNGSATFQFSFDVSGDAPCAALLHINTVSDNPT